MKTQPQILIIGQGPERNCLQNLAHQLNIKERCHFVDAIKYEEMVDYMNAIDLLVLPSRTTPNWKEQFGRVLVEAMACKVVVIGSDSGAIPEVIGSAGRIFPEGDSLSLANAIDDLISNVSLYQTLSQVGYQRALENYTVEQLAVKTLKVWQDLVSQTTFSSEQSEKCALD